MTGDDRPKVCPVLSRLSESETGYRLLEIRCLRERCEAWDEQTGVCKITTDPTGMERSLDRIAEAINLSLRQ